MKRTSSVLALGALALAGPAIAADHNEAVGTIADDISDIDDVYVWHTADGKVVVAVTFGGPGAEGGRVIAGYDSQTIYGVHIDTDADGVADHDVWVRFGQNGAGDWGVQFTGIPGADPVVEGAVATTLAAGGIGLSAVAGVYDDPFFFDFQGFIDTLDTGAVSFSNTRDSFAGMNVNAIVFELDAAAVGASSFKLWATSGRK